ncbi:MAG: hypothetical protein PQJ50_10660 [Spirochaetales bacterium]|nr:hypothetical protein [Spirochaetales bacterium]
MKIEDEDRFISQVEHLIDPAEVCDLYFFQRFKNFLPRRVFKGMLIKTSALTPYMGFVIEPYCLFLFFKLKDIERARSMLPERYELVKSSIIADEEPDYYHGMGIFNTRASTFWGTRQESYLIARDKETGLISWVFIDIISNTLIALPKPGVADRNSSRCVYTTSSKGNIYLDIEEEDTGRHLKLNGNITRGVRRGLDQPLWIDGNTSVAHSRDLSDGHDDPFAVIFDPAEVESALDIPLADIDLELNNLFPGLAEPELSRVLCFPYAQHYIADSPGCRTYIRNKEDMIENYNEIAKRTDLKTFSTKSIKRMFLFSGFAVGICLAALIILQLT